MPIMLLDLYNWVTDFSITTLKDLFEMVDPMLCLILSFCIQFAYSVIHCIVAELFVFLEILLYALLYEFHYK